MDDHTSPRGTPTSFDRRGEFVATIESNGEKASEPYHDYAYNKNGTRPFEGSVTIKWVRCNIVY